MAKEERHRNQIEVPKAWLPEFETVMSEDDGSRHYLILQAIRKRRR
jgi:hypothetical protein